MSHRTNLGRIVLAVVVCITLIAGCDSKSRDSDTDQVSDVIVNYNEFLTECLSGPDNCDPARADDLAVDSAREELATVMTELGSGGMSMEVSIEVSVGEVTIDRDTATADACGIANLSSMEIGGELQDTAEPQPPTWANETYYLRKGDSGWRISSVEPGESGSVTDGSNPCGP